MPLGYEPAEWSLEIVEEEADTVRRIFDLYLEIKSIYAVRQAAKDLSLRTKARPRMGAKKYRQADARGTKGWPSAVIGPAPFGVTNIHYILTNSVYAGRIRHREQRQTGNHPASSSLTYGMRSRKSLRPSLPGRAPSATSPRCRYWLAIYLMTAATIFQAEPRPEEGRALPLLRVQSTDVRKQAYASANDHGWRLPRQRLKVGLLRSRLTTLQIDYRRIWLSSLCRSIRSNG